MALLDFSNAPHGGRVHLLPESAGSPQTSPRLLIYHSMVGSFDGTRRYFEQGTNLESTLAVRLNGYCEQWMDTEREADANYRANPFAISVETEDDGDPDTMAWTRQQLDTLVWIAWEVHRLHPQIPLRRADAWDGSGIGYHTLWGAPSNWTPVRKTCPGRARVAQFPMLLDRIKAGGQGGLTLSEAQDILDAIAALRRDATVYGTKGFEETVEAFAQRQRDTLAKLDALDGRLDGQQRQIDALAVAYNNLAALAGTGNGGVLTPEQMTQAIAAFRASGADMLRAAANTLAEPTEPEPEPSPEPAP